MPASFDEIADELYRTPLAGFLPARTTAVKAAKAAGDRDLAERIGQLRKPSAAAWAVNQLVWTEPEQVREVLDLGGQLRLAQAQLSGAQLRQLGNQRNQLVAALAARCAAVASAAGTPLSDAVVRQVTDTLNAAILDPQIGAAVQAGRLTVAQAYSGFGDPAGLAGLRLAKTPSEAGPDGGAAHRNDVLDRLKAALDAVAAADAELTESAREQADTESQRQSALAEVERITAELTRAKERLRFAEHAADKAHKRHAAATEHRTSTRTALANAQAEVAGLLS